MPMRTIVLADDCALVREELKAVLARRADLSVASEAADGLELLRVLEELDRPDLVILDISMPKLDGIEALRTLRRLDPSARVLVFTMHRDEGLLIQAFLAGADGYLLKDDAAKELFVAIDGVLEGRTYISPTMQREVKDAWLKTFVSLKESHPGEPLSSQEIDLLRHLAGEEPGRRKGGSRYD